jgi:glycosyltransferase involved in cell wall biosynthesis
LAPHISVLLPCYNAAVFLPDCIASISTQTFGDFEVIAVDDGSTDDSGEILRDWAARDQRVLVVAPGRVGLVRALQLASTTARGSLLARMDADDIAHPSRFQRQLGWLAQHPELAACGTQVRYFPQEHVRAGARAYQHWLNSLITPEQLIRDVFVECPIAHPALIIKRAAFAAVGGYQQKSWPEDYDLILRLWVDGYLLANVPEVLLDWREREDRISRTDPRYSQPAFQRCKAHYLAKTILRSRPVIVWGAGPVGKAIARALMQEGANLQAFIDIDPRKVGQRPYGIPVRSPDSLADRTSEYILAAVGSADAREQIRHALLELGLVEGVDFCAVA